MTDILGTGGAFHDINDRGQIVGWRDPDSGPYHALLWEDGMMTDLGTLGGEQRRRAHQRPGARLRGGASPV